MSFSRSKSSRSNKSEPNNRDMLIAGDLQEEVMSQDTPQLKFQKSRQSASVSKNNLIKADNSEKQHEKAASNIMIPKTQSNPKPEELEIRLNRSHNRITMRLRDIEKILETLKSHPPGTSAAFTALEDQLMQSSNQIEKKLESRMLEQTKVTFDRCDELETLIRKSHAESFEDHTLTREFQSEIRALDYKIQACAHSLKDFDELRTLRLEYDSITAGLVQQTQKLIQQGIVKEVLQSLPDLNVLEAQVQFRQDQINTRIDICDKNLERAGKDLSQVRKHFESELQNYVQFNEFTTKIDEMTQKNESGLENYVLSSEYRTLVEKCENLTNLEFTQQLQDSLDSLRSTVQQSYLSRKEFESLEEGTRNWVRSCYVAQKDFEIFTQDQNQKMRLLINKVDKSDKKSEQALALIDSTRQELVKIHDLAIASINLRLDSAEKQMSRFALYEDYRKLYQKVVPPLKLIQEQNEEVLTSHLHTKELLLNFDQNMANYALKHEIKACEAQLRVYCKADAFQTHLDYFALSKANLTKMIEAQAEQTQQKYISLIKETKSIVKKHLSAARRENVFRQDEPLDKQMINQLKFLTENTKQLLNSKADAEDIRLLFESKTNKVDTEHCMRCIDVMKNQIETISVLVVELFGQNIGHLTKKQLTSFEEQRAYLRQQSENLVNSIKKVDLQMKVAVPQNLFGLHNFSERHIDLRSPVNFKKESQSGLRQSLDVILQQKSYDQSNIEQWRAQKIEQHNFQTLQNSETRFLSPLSLPGSPKRQPIDVQSRNFGQDSIRLISNSVALQEKLAQKVSTARSRKQIQSLMKTNNSIELQHCLSVSSNLQSQLDSQSKSRALSRHNK